MEQEAIRERYEIVSQPTPENMDRIAREDGFLKFQFRHPAGAWRNEYPMRPDETPLTRAVFSVVEP